MLDSDAANKEYVDNRDDAVVTYLKGLVEDAVRTINSLQYQINDLMNSAALDIPSATFVELTILVQAQEIRMKSATSFISLLNTNQNTVYTNLRLIMKVIRDDGNLETEVVRNASGPQGVSGTHNFTQKYTFNFPDISLSESKEPALIGFDLMCDIYATGGARPYTLKSHLYNMQNDPTFISHIGF